MIVLDATVLIAYLDSNDAHHPRAQTLLVREIGDDFAASSMSLVEVLVVPSRAGRVDAVLRALSDLDVGELPFPADAAVKLGQLRASTRCTMPDCCVLLAAEQAQARVASFDDALNRAATALGLITVSE